ncbi:MAG: RdgB/HAM1 family non-canonical purine NTP pyrophosphatase [Candidatus Gastranaerophilales bacterium]|nr:RdgB/HAM1 family non-canonical purine NTP pyrophosphatase [Candidatus Gastranaerophilales bacterium]
MTKIILATTNPHKLEEINLINSNMNIQFNIINQDFNPEENGKTFQENSIIKAKEAAKITGEYCLADDSGLCTDALEGRPGIYSARYAADQKAKINKLLEELKNVPYEYRTAHFICAMTLVNPKGEIIHTETGKIYGYIDDEPKGGNGFGYDPIFFIPEYNQTMAQLPQSVKNSISHRANALKSMLKWIECNL